MLSMLAVSGLAYVSSGMHAGASEGEGALIEQTSPPEATPCKLSHISQPTRHSFIL